MTRLNLDTYVVSPFDEWVSASTKSYEYIKSFEEAIDDPIIVLHSSGSTGDPKPITNTNGFFAMADRPLPVCEGREHGGIALLDYEGGGSYFSPFPGFHLAGITALAFFPVMMKSASTILGLPDRPPSIDMVRRSNPRSPQAISLTTDLTGSRNLTREETTCALSSSINYRSTQQNPFRPRHDETSRERGIRRRPSLPANW